MKSLKYILLSCLVLLAASCVKENIRSIDRDNELSGDKVRVSFGVGFASRESDNWGDGEKSTKAFDEMDKTKRDRLIMRVYVFDQYGLFTEFADAEVLSPQPSTIPPDDDAVAADETVFSVELTRSKNPRRLHFVAVDDVSYSVTQQYTYGSEGTFMKGLTVSNGVDAYWARILVDGIDESTHFRRVPLLRNFAKITVNCKDPIFVPNGFTILNVPSSGCVAPYNTYSGGFASFFTTTNQSGVLNTTVATYKDLLNTQHFKGYRPLDVAWTRPTPASGTGDSGLDFNDVTADGDHYNSDPFYMYESPNSEGDEKGKTFMIIRGKYDGGANNTYYKIDITYKETEGYGYTDEEILNGAGVATFYNILRNFSYVININGVTFEGYSSAYEAATKPAANNISASILAEGVNNVSDGNDKRRLFVNKIYAMYNDAGAKQNLKTKAYTYDGFRQDVKLKMLEEDDGMFTVEPYVDYSVSPDSEDYNPIKFTLTAPTATPKTAVIRVYINESPTYETLFRDITVVSRLPYSLRVDCTDVVPSTNGSTLNAQLLVPDGISKNLFPLSFLMEPESKTIYPDATQNQLPVNVGKSILPGHASDNSFQFVKTITYTEYENADYKVIGGIRYKLVDVWYKTNTASSKTRIHAYNEYFEHASDTFENGDPVFEDGDLAVVKIVASDYYGAGNSYNYVVFKTRRATGNVTITLTETYNGTPYTQQRQNYSLADGTDRTGPVGGIYTYKVPFLTKTFKGSDYTAEVSYSDSSFNQTISGSATQERRYLFLPLGSFAPTNLTSAFGSTERFKSGIIYDPAHFETIDPANTGKVAFNASGTTELDNRVADASYEGFTFADNTGYHIGVYRHAAFFSSLDESWKIRFYHSTSGKHNAPEDGSHTWRDDWYAEVTVGALTAAHAKDFQAGATDNASAPADGLYKMALTFVDPATAP